MQIVLYSFRRCPYAMRARMALHVAQIAVEHREIELKAKPQHLLSISPKGTVPVLWIKAGELEEVVDQSLEIMKWSLARFDPEDWLSQGQGIESEVFGLIDKNDQDFKFNLDRYKYPHRFGLSDPMPFRVAGTLFLEQLELMLTQNNYLFGTHRGIADVAIMPFVRQFSRVDPTWFESLPLKHLRAWLANLENSELFVSIMARRSLWSQSQQGPQCT
jgi:glutathione S-transferase